MRANAVGVFLALLANGSASGKGLTTDYFDAGDVRAEVGRRVTFGLTAKQVQAIRVLSSGNVRLDRLLAAPSSSRESSILAKQFPAAGRSDNRVPPPVIVTDADPELVGQWWIDALNVPTAWERASGAGVVIADCDAGYYTEESDLVPNLLLEQRFDVSDLDDPLTVNDGNFVSHGTSVSAIMAGALDGIGTNGIAYNAKVVPLQNFNYSSSLDDMDKEEATAKCILKALEYPEVRIVVLENQTAEGSSETFAGTRDAVTLALSAGVVIVSAGGNYSRELTIEAAYDTGSIIVGALTQEGAKASWSNYGPRVTVAAFGERLRTLAGPNGRFADFGGTSGATPQVAAAVALMLEVNPELTPAQIRQILVDTRTTNTRNNLVGGFLNVVGALDQAGATPADMIEFTRTRAFRAALVEILRAE